MDAHGSYVALSRHRDGVDLHYAGDDFANQDRLTRTLSRDRPKDMASDYEHLDPAQNYAERRGITFRERVAEIVRKVVPERVRNMFDGLRPSAEAVSGTGSARRPEQEAPERKVVEDPEAVLRKTRTKALVRHARAVDAIFDMQELGGKANPEQVKELQEARKVFEEVRPYGSHDAEAAYKKNPELAREAAGGQLLESRQGDLDLHGFRFFASVSLLLNDIDARCAAITFDSKTRSIASHARIL